MPPLPKRRRSKSRQGTINSHRAKTLTGLSECPHCHRPVPSHRVCPNCGYYKGRDILGIESAAS